MLSSSSSSASAGTARHTSRASPLVLPYVDCAVLLLLPTLVNLSAANQLGLSRVSVSIIFLGLLLKNVFVYAAVSAQWQARVNAAFRSTFHSSNTLLWLLIALLALLLVAEVRGFFTSTAPFTAGIGFFLWSMSLLGYLLSVATLNTTAQSRRMLFISLVAGVGVFVLANVAGYYLGLRGFNTLESVGQNQMLSAVGLNVQRVALPFSSGVNNFGAMSGFGMICGFMLCWRGRGAWVRLLGLLVCGLGLAGMVLVDSRASVGISLIACAFAAMASFRPTLAWTVRLIPFFVLAAPVFLLIAAAALSGTEAAQLIVRDGDFARRLGVLTARDVVWKSGYGILSTPELIHLVGYGAVGHYTSGATQDYSWVFGQIAGQSANTLHNANLQVVFDIGYIGFAVWFAFWVTLMLTVSRLLLKGNPTAETVIIAAVSIFIALSGVFEVAGTSYYPDLFVMVMLVTAFLMPVREAVQRT